MGVIKKLTRAQGHTTHIGTDITDIPNFKYSMKGATRKDGREITEDFGNRKPDGAVSSKEV